MDLALILAAGLNMACIEQQLQHGNDSQTLAQLKQRCQLTQQVGVENAETSIVRTHDELANRIEQEKAIDSNRFGLSSYYNNYVLLGSYNNNPNSETWEYAGTNNDSIDPWELKFQFSFKVPITPNWFGDDSGLYIAYTNQSWWQAYNKEVSAPFRDTNHMPELVWLHQVDDYGIGDWDLQIVSLSLNHQSNGRSGSASRSWNRIIASAAVNHNRWLLGARAWYRLPEDEKSYPEDPRGDDNPDITDYMGHGEIFGIYSYDDHNLSFRARGNVAHHQGGLELGWSFPLKGKLRGYLQGYWGYGENLLDYNHKSERLSVGVELTPLL